ncbi:MAG TPA: hypothetical protein QF359_09295 [Rhodospirillales bacterium]|nr:hypothetical protein [Rhodospirillales bacterium]MDP7623629.1 hypothetical protein [Rhodospirillales bacterium]HJO87143.1 hypothetical protein [Rhodospirillales bacterium]
MILSRLALMDQAAVLNGQFFDLFSPFDDGGVTPEVGGGGCAWRRQVKLAVRIVS